MNAQIRIPPLILCHPLESERRGNNARLNKQFGAEGEEDRRRRSRESWGGGGGDGDAGGGWCGEGVGGC